MGSDGGRCCCWDEGAIDGLSLSSWLEWGWEDKVVEGKEEEAGEELLLQLVARLARAAALSGRAAGVVATAHSPRASPAYLNAGVLLRKCTG